MKTLLFLGILTSAVYASGSEVNWNHCARHVLNRNPFREIKVEYDSKRQELLAAIDPDGTKQTQFENVQAALNGEVQKTVEKELARIYPGANVRLQDLRREERTLRNGDRVIYWYRGKDLLVRRVILPKDEDQAKPGQLLTHLSRENQWSARPTLGAILVFGPERKPLAEIQLAQHLGVDRPYAFTEPAQFVEGAVPYVSAIYHFEFTSRQEVVLDRPDRQEQRARSVARNRERRFREATRNPQYSDEDERVDYGQSMLSFDRAFEPTRAESVTLPSHPYVTEKWVFNTPTLYSTENSALSLMDRLAAHGTYIEGGAVTYEERDGSGKLQVRVECNAANYCVETWYEGDRVIRSVNGRGQRLVRTDNVNRQRVETRPNEDFPWNPYRIPGMALHLAPRATPARETEVMIDPMPFFQQQSVVMFGFQTTATVVGP